MITFEDINNKIPMKLPFLNTKKMEIMTFHENYIISENDNF